MSNLNYFMNDLPKCPHCDEDFDIWQGDYFEYNLSDDETNEATCKSCRKEFIFKNHISHSFSTATSVDDLYNDVYGPSSSKGEA